MSNWINILDILYPIGSIYLSYASISPGTTIGGTWTQISGKFLRCHTDVTTGGSDTHTLTILEMPSHTHKAYARNWNVVEASTGNTAANAGQEIGNWGVQPVGGSQPHNNMPAYQNVYCWRRTA